MFGKVIIFGLFEMIQKKKKKSDDHVPESGFDLRVGSGTTTRVSQYLPYVVSQPSKPWSI